MSMFLDAEFPVPLASGLQHGPPPTLPLRRAFSNHNPEIQEQIPASMLDATSLRGLLNAVIEYGAAATSELDEVFGERA